jgi:hypothetical protein
MAQHCATTGWNAPGEGKQRVVSLAARALKDWPTNFISLLKMFAHKEFIAEPKTTVSKCKEIYRPLFTDYAQKGKKDTDFILSVLIEYAANQWDYRDALQMERFHDRLPTGLLSSKHFNLQLSSGTMDSSLHPLEVDGTMDAIDCDPRNFAPGQKPANFLGPNLVAQRLGISTVLLLAIVESGLCKSHKLSSGDTAFFGEDIDAFKHSLLQLPRMNQPEVRVDQCVSLQAALSWHWDSVENKVELVRALREGQIEIVASTGDTIGGLQMDRAAYHRFIGAVRRRSTKDSVSATEAAKTLGCDRGLIPGLVRFGALLGSDLPSGLRIDKVSLDGFKRNYVFVITIAKTLHTNTARLVAYCGRIGIPVTWPTRGSRKRAQPFMRCEDAERLMKAMYNAKTANRTKASTKSPVPSQSSSSEWRYWEISFPGSPLQRLVDRRSGAATGNAYAASRKSTSSTTVTVEQERFS